MNTYEIIPPYFKIDDIHGKFVLSSKEVVPVKEDGWHLGNKIVASYYNNEYDCEIILTELRIVNQYVDDIVYCVDNLEDDAYYHMIEEIKRRSGLRILITQVEDETSDIIIVYDYFGDKTAISYDLMYSLIEKAKKSKYKHVKIKYGKIEPITGRLKC